ncbi:MAG TPA: (2Fe-2S)-binding protein [Candidatus Limnocylindria bacterium]|jgi:nicotinate dehydrogenase subunit A|nr:(2Fe-2S)-binding protein [Candidatus Limnocylindria bacterium]
MRLVLTINGSRHDVDPPPSASLLSVLRDDLGLCGTRFGCGSGQCGACYVIADGRAVASCLMPARQAAEREITTIEGLAQDGGLHPVQEAFIAEDAMQCGYCTSGMIISAAALLARDAAPDEATIRDTLAGNLCRCGVYGRAIRAVLRAAQVPGGRGEAPAITG